MFAATFNGKLNIVAKTNMTKDQLIDTLARCELERGTWSDNLAMALLDDFEGHIDYEDLGTDDREVDIWAKNQMKKCLDYIAEQVLVAIQEDANQPPESFSVEN